MLIVPFAEREVCAPQRLLIVDHLASTADSLAKIFSQQGYEVKRAYSAEDALKVVESWQPDVLISDIIMTGMNGLELAKELTRRIPHCRVILFSGQVSDLIAAEALSLGFSFFHKPVSPSVLIHNVRSLSPK